MIKFLVVNDRVKLKNNPFGAGRYGLLKSKTQIVKEVRKVSAEGTTGQWVKTNLITDWVDKFWFKKVYYKSKKKKKNA